MADLFLSYSSRDRAVVTDFALAMTRRGLTVAWDADIPIGAEFEEYLNQQIREARLVIVFWSENSIQSTFVLSEAAYAYDQKKLLAAALSNFDLQNLPPPFNLLQTIRLELSGSRGIAFERLLGFIRSRLAPARAADIDWGRSDESLDQPQRGRQSEGLDHRAEPSASDPRDDSEGGGVGRNGPPAASEAPITGTFDQAFISYSRADQTVCDRLAELIAAQGVSVFVDRSMPGGQRWKREIITRIDNSMMMVVIVSRNSDGSVNVAKEVGRAIERSKPILPVYIEQFTLSGDLGYDLSNLNYRDISGNIPSLLPGIAAEVKSIVSVLGRSRVQSAAPLTFERTAETRAAVRWRWAGLFALVLGVVAVSAMLSVVGADRVMRWLPTDLTKQETSIALFLLFLPYCLLVLRLLRDLALKPPPR